MNISEIFIEITGGKQPMCTIKELARVMRKQPKTIYAYRSGTSQPNWDDTCELAEYLIKNYDYYKLAMQAFPVGPDSADKLDEQLIEIMTAALQCMRGDKKELTNGIGRMTFAFEKLKTKGSQL